MDENRLNALREELNKNHRWPSEFMFKFIVPNTSEKVALTMELFNNESDITMHESSTGKFISITARELMLDVDSIIKDSEYISANEIRDYKIPMEFDKTKNGLDYPAVLLELFMNLI